MVWNIQLELYLDSPYQITDFYGRTTVIIRNHPYHFLGKDKSITDNKSSM